MVFLPTRRSFIAALSAGLSTVAGTSQVGIAETLLPTDTQPADESTLWYRTPATKWTDALPIGNGCFGAMVFGGGAQGCPSDEFLQLNHDTLWSGQPRSSNNPDARKYLPDVRQAVLVDKNYHLADKLCQKMQGPFMEGYQPLGNLRISFSHADVPTDYRRELNLDTACARTEYISGNTRYLREAFVSAPDNAIVLQASASKPGMLHCTISLDADLQQDVRATENGEILLIGKASAHMTMPHHPGGDHPLTSSEIPGAGMFFIVKLRAKAVGGSVKAYAGSLVIEGATTITLLITAATGYRGPWTAPDTPLAIVSADAERQMSAVARKSFATLKRNQRRDHQQLFRRVRLQLGNPSPNIPTDERLNAFAETPDPSLVALYFNFGRYLLISSSRPGSQPANLQGIWNPLPLPPWSSNWTTNINLQMNYWPAELCNLGECAMPLFRLIEELHVSGTRTAKESYGLPGWCVHHNVDLWRSTNAVGQGVGLPEWANWVMAAPWLCAHLYQHYLFTQDLEFLRTRAYPAMKGAAEFCLAWLVEDGNGRLTTCPSESTENEFLAPDGKLAMTSAGCTMDMALIRELFTNCIITADLLQMDAEWAAKLSLAKKRLIPYQVGRLDNCRSGPLTSLKTLPASGIYRTCILCIRAMK